MPSESKCNDNHDHEPSAVHVNVVNSGITRIGSAGILQVNAEERARILHQQRHLSLQRRGRASISKGGNYYYSNSNNGDGDDGSDNVFAAVRMRQFSAPKGSSNNRRCRSTALPTTSTTSTTQHSISNSKYLNDTNNDEHYQKQQLLEKRERRNNTKSPSYIQLNHHRGDGDDERKVNDEEDDEHHHTDTHHHCKKNDKTSISKGDNNQWNGKFKSISKSRDSSKGNGKSSNAYIPNVKQEEQEAVIKDEQHVRTKPKPDKQEYRRIDAVDIVVDNVNRLNVLNEPSDEDDTSNSGNIINAELGLETTECAHTRIVRDETKSMTAERERLDLDNKSEDLRNFVMRPVNSPIQCYIKRTKKSILKPVEYRVFLKDGDRFLMFSKKRANKKTSNYLIRIDEPSASKEQSEDASQESVVGKLRANFLGTEFTIYDSGINPLLLNLDTDEDYSEAVRSELGGIVYETNVMGSKGPRKMQVCINKINEDTDQPMKKWQPIHSDEQMIASLKGSNTLSSFVVKMKNKQPKWSDQLDAYVLNFNGRVTKASVKNFQLVEEDDENERIILQFGRVSKDEFTMDLDWPMSPMQAFCICLSSFDSKIACD